MASTMSFVDVNGSTVYKLSSEQGTVLYGIFLLAWIPRVCMAYFTFSRVRLDFASEKLGKAINF